ncbi:MAG: cell division protein FtsL [Proteobacteria bacterium]|nr:cell division protein FtsL [Pseudomonadota bacterium]
MNRGFIGTAVLFGSVALALSAVSLFMVKHKVQELNRQLHMVKRNIISEQENIHVLKAEWAYLTQPQIIQKLANQYLQLQPIQPTQIIKHNMEEYAGQPK